MNVVQDNDSDGEAYRMQLHAPKIQDIGAKLSLSISNISLIFAYSHQQWVQYHINVFFFVLFLFFVLNSNWIAIARIANVL